MTLSRSTPLIAALALLIGCADEAPIPPPVVHVHSAEAPGIFVNGYLVEVESGVIAIDAMLTVSDATALRARLDALGKPLLAVLVTHGHPDHYNGITELTRGLDVPIIATAGVDEIIRRDDAAKEQQWEPVFGDEWPEARTFPDQLVAPGETVELGGVSFTVRDLGPGESHHDSYWLMEVDREATAAFVGDAVFNGVHSYMSDGHTATWLDNLDLLGDELAGVADVYPGHGAPGGAELLAGQRQYIELYRDTVASLAQGQPALTEDDKAQLTTAMKEYLPTDKLEFLIALGADAVAAELAAAAE